MLAWDKAPYRGTYRTEKKGEERDEREERGEPSGVLRRKRDGHSVPIPSPPLRS